MGNQAKASGRSAGVLRGLAFAAAIGAMGYAFIVKPAPQDSPRAEVFDRVWYLVSENFYGADLDGVDWKASRERFRPIALAARDTKELYDKAIWPMLDQISASHVDAARPGKGSSAVTEKVGHFSDRRGEALSSSSDGIGDLGGVDAVFDGKRWYVYDVRKGSEADAAGVAPGLAITSLYVDEAPKGRYKTKLGFTDASGQSSSASYEFTPRVRASSRTAVTRPSGAVVLRFDGFDKETIDWALSQIGQAEPAPLILDLRENHGGDIDETLRFLSALLPDNVSIGNSAGRRYPYNFALKMANDGKEYRGRIAVLIGPKSASAAELTSYALGKHRKAPLVGERTAGAVLAAHTFILPDGGELMVATGNFTNEDNERLEGVGVSPTIPAAPTLEAIRAGRDLSVEAAERAIVDHPEGAPASALSSAPAP